MKIETIRLSDETLPLGGGLDLIQTTARRDEVRSAVLSAMPDMTGELLVRRSSEARRAFAAAFDAERRESLAAAERDLADAERRMRLARSEKRRTALTSLSRVRGGTDEAQRRRNEAAAAFATARAALDELPYTGMTPDEVAAKTAADVKRADELALAARRMPTPVPVVLALVGAVLAAALSPVLPWRAACLLLGGALLILFAGLLVRYVVRRRACRSCIEERSRILSGHGVSSTAAMRRQAERYSEAWSDRARAEAALAEAEDALTLARAEQQSARARTLEELDFTGGDGEAARLGREVERLKARTAALRSAGDEARDALEAALTSPEGEPLVLMDVLGGLDAMTAQPALALLRGLARHRQVLLVEAGPLDTTDLDGDAGVRRFHVG